MRIIIFFLLTAIGCIGLANAQDSRYPKGPVKVLVGYPAGQTTDFIARTIAEKLSDRWKQPVIIENIPGAGSGLAAAAVARSKNDGQTLLVTANAAMVIGPHIYEKVNYDTFKDFDFVNLSIWVPYVCAVSNSIPAQDVSSLRQYTKANPDKVSYGSPGTGTISHLTMERLKAEYEINVLHVPYKGSGAVLTDLVAGNIQFACEPALVMAPLIKAGRIKPMAVTSETRLPMFPNVPTIAETYPGFLSGAWIGFVVPKGVPNPIIQQINTDITSIIKESTVKEKFETAGLIVLGEGPSQFLKLAQSDNERYGKLVRQLNLKP